MKHRTLPLPLSLSPLRRWALAPALSMGLGLLLGSPAFAQSGNSPGDPYDLGLLNSSRVVTGNVQSDDPVDVYRFDVAESVRAVDLVIPRSSLTGYVDMVLAQDRNGNSVIEDDEILADDRGYSGVDARILSWLNPGTFFVRVTAARGYETPYQLTLSQSARPDSAGAEDDTLALALLRPGLVPNTPVRDFVGPSDPADVFRFEVTGQVHDVRVVIPQTSLTGYLRLQLIRDDNGNQVPEEDEILDSALGYSGSAAAVQAWLNPGQYFIRVLESPGYRTPYDLTLSQTAKESSGGALDDSITLSHQRPLLAHARPVSDYVGPSDPADFYRIEVVGSVTEVQAVLPKATLTGYATLTLVRDDNRNGVVEDEEIMDTSTGYSGADARVEAWLDPGTYYLRVAALRGYGPTYTLTLSQSAKPTSAGNQDNQPATAVPLGHILGPRQIDDFVGSPDLNDLYRFDVTGPRRKVTLLLPKENLRGYAKLTLFTDVNEDAILEPVIDDVGYSSISALIERELSPGRYYVEVARHSGQSTPYRLVLSRTFASAVAPFVIVPPAPVTIPSGKPATFNILADGSGTLAYQWFLDGILLPGATSPTLVLNDQIAEVRDYQVSVRISNTQGNLTTEPVRLQVTPADAALGIARAVLLSWPLQGTEGYVLQGAPSPDGPWTFLTNRPVMTLGNRREVAVEESGALGFYRLTKP